MVRLYSFTEHTFDLETSEDPDNFSEQAIAVSQEAQDTSRTEGIALEPYDMADWRTFCPS